MAVITNASLLWREDVRRDLMRGDWVSLKLDAATESVWRRVNRPHRGLVFDMVLRGILDFSASYRGVLTTETMLVGGLNDRPEHLERWLPAWPGWGRGSLTWRSHPSSG